MSVPIKYFFYDQTNAPQCTGEIGKLDAILYACLVTGYNPKSVSSITVSNNIATVTTSTNHGYSQYDIIKIEGANEPVFNGEFYVATVPTSTTFTVALTTNLTSATGTITCKIAPLGWTREFSGTNKSVYRSPDVTGTRLYLRVDDTATYYTQVNIYESMTSVDVGSGKSIDLWWQKSSTSNSAVRGWSLVGDAKRFYLMTCYNTSYLTNWSMYAFGDFNPFRAYDPWSCMLCGHTVSTAYQNTPDTYISTQSTNGGTAGMLIARGNTGLGGNVGFGMYSAMRWSGIGYTSTTGFMPYPSPADNTVHLAPIYVYDATAAGSSIRGTMPGFYSPLEAANGVFPLKDRSIVQGGRTYMAFRSAYGSSYGNYWLDITGPW